MWTFGESLWSREKRRSTQKRSFSLAVSPGSQLVAKNAAKEVSRQPVAAGASINNLMYQEEGKNQDAGHIERVKVES